jgi:Uri superfamily endonuclease
MPDATIPMAGFGSSDCGCPTHLFRFSPPPNRFAGRVNSLAQLPGVENVPTFLL